MEIKRDMYLKRLIDRKHDGLIKVISGIRRCGKSYLLFKLFKNHLLDNGVPESHIITIALDDYANKEYRKPDVAYEYVKSRIKDNGQYYVMIDEIQMMDEFVDVLNGFLHMENVDVYVTGSSSKLISSEIVTEFRGRGEEIRVYPLSFAEFYSAIGGDWSAAWRLYSTFGGMPAVVAMTNEAEKMSYLDNLFKETYIRDIIERKHIRNNADDLSDLVNIVASGIGGMLNPLKLSNTFKSVKKSDISSSTISRYLDYLQDSFIISKAARFDIKGKKYISTPAKYYFTDIGLRNSRLNFRQQEETHIMENIIYNELNIRGYKVDVGEVGLFEHSIKKQVEVDFVANFGDKRYYIQSAAYLPDGDKKRQEERPLLGIKDSFKKIIVVKDDIRPNITENGTVIMGVKDFLLNPNSLENIA